MNQQQQLKPQSSLQSKDLKNKSSQQQLQEKDLFGTKKRSNILKMTASNNFDTIVSN